jgi:RND superfamily putative drug exporter
VRRAVGVLLDLLLILTVLVPAVVISLGRWTWWPSPRPRRAAA